MENILFQLQVEFVIIAMILVKLVQVLLSISVLVVTLVLDFCIVMFVIYYVIISSFSIQLILFVKIVIRLVKPAHRALAIIVSLV